MKFLSTIFCMLLFAQVAMSQKIVELPAFFSDNMVLQQKTQAPIWGKAAISGDLKINASWGASVSLKVYKDSVWKAKLATPKAGGSYEITFSLGNSSLVIKNVSIGEVWLCSGQSNMEMPLIGWPPRDTIQNSASSIKNSANKNIRLFTVSRTVSTQKESNVIGKWSECSPENVAQFSAVAYFFGKKLQEELKIPIGLINSSWGGTMIEPWISWEYLKELTAYKDVLDTLVKSGEEQKALNAWIEKHKSFNIADRDAATKWEGLDFEDNLCEKPDYNDSAWKNMELPTYWEKTDVGEFDGTVWFRKSIEIPDSWLNKDLTVELGPIDDMDKTYANGVLIGSYEKEGFWQTNRVYNISKELTKDKKITIAVRVLDNQGGGGFGGTKEQMKIYPVGSSEKIMLDGNWKFLPVAELWNAKFYVYGAKGEEFFNRPKMSVNLGSNTPTVLYNGMINPLIGYGIKGAIWYQGESNTGAPATYDTLFPLMINNWRTVWKQGDFPFYYVQLAPYVYGEYTKSQRLREAQFKTLSVKNTGMAVTLDISDSATIHPPYKKEVGGRLAAIALAKNYGKNIPYSGPVYKSMKIEKNKIILTFDYALKGLKIKNQNRKNNFLIAGSDQVFKTATVTIKGNKLIVSNAGISKPAAVRYCWSNTDYGTLFNGAGLPASSFRTDEWGK